MFDPAHEDFLAGREYERAAEDRAARAAEIAAGLRDGRRAGAREARRRYLDHTQAHVLFADRILSWHRPLREVLPWPMCSCGRAGRCCPYLETAREFFPVTHPLPWEPLDQAEWGPA